MPHQILQHFYMPVMLQKISSKAMPAHMMGNIFFDAQLCGYFFIQPIAIQLLYWLSALLIVNRCGTACSHIFPIDENNWLVIGGHKYGLGTAKHFLNNRPIFPTLRNIFGPKTTNLLADS